MLRFLLIILAVFIAEIAGAQPQTAGHQAGFAVKEKAMDAFLDSIYLARTATSNGFINGQEHYPYYARALNSPILFDGNERTASLTMNGRTYSGLILQYDTYKDEIILPGKENKIGTYFMISLNRNNISSFTLMFSYDTLRFRYFGEDETGGIIPPGFYEVAYEGPPLYIIRHRSRYAQHDAADDYYYSPAGYILTPEGFVKITSRGKFAKLFGERAAVIRKIIHSQHVRLRKADKHQIITVLEAFNESDKARQDL